MNDPHRPECYCRRCRGERVRNQRYIEREAIVSRTDDLRSGGAIERPGSGGSGGAPFVKWSDGYSWLEGEIIGTFKTKYGLAATMKVSAVSVNGLDTQGLDEEGNRFQGNVVVGEEVNVGMGSATLDGKITEDDKDKSFHIAFEGWEEPKGGGNRYRLFTVVDLAGVSPRSAEGLPQREAVPANDSDERPIEDTSGF